MLFAAMDLLARRGSSGPGFLIPLVVLGLLGLLIGWAIRRRRGGSLHGDRAESPVETLRNRFARGEIDKAEFDHRSAVLVGADVVPPAPDESASPTPDDPDGDA